MNTLFSKIVKISILLGALFFSGIVIKANEYTIYSDTIPLPDSLSQADALLTKGDSLHSFEADTTFQKERIQISDTLNHKRKHYPAVATICSALIPGLGQAYNRKYWKIPILYAAGYGLYYFIDQYNQDYHLYKELQTIEYNNDPDKSTQEQMYLSYESAKLSALKWRNTDILFLGLLYVANVVDAMVDAHFYNYDVNDDLSISLSPAILSVPVNTYGGLTMGLSINFHLK